MDESAISELQDSKTLDQMDLSRWMENLPKRLLDLPINMLAIPGSHDSFTFYLDHGGPVSPDEPDWMQKCVQFMGGCARKIIYNWSSVQSLGVNEQLRSGIRYFDIRLAAKSNCDDKRGKNSVVETAKSENSNLYCVHGFYGLCIDECLSQIASYLADHGREVVILDFNHFYNISHESHYYFIEKIFEIFGSKLCPVSDLRRVSLNFMWQMGYQLIVSYHHCLAHEFPRLWPGCYIKSPWPNTGNVSQLLETLERNYEQRHGRHETCFYVTQGVLTPSTTYVLCHVFTTLKKSLAKIVAKPFLDWVQGKTIGKDGINICILDSIELDDYARIVVGLNHRYRSSSTDSPKNLRC